MFSDDGEPFRELLRSQRGFLPSDRPCRCCLGVPEASKAGPPAMLTYIQLQRIGVFQADEFVVECVAEREPTATTKWMVFGHDDDKSIGREWEALDFRDIDQIGGDADVSQPC